MLNRDIELKNINVIVKVKRAAKFGLLEPDYNYVDIKLKKRKSYIIREAFNIYSPTGDYVEMVTVEGRIIRVPFKEFDGLGEVYSGHDLMHKKK